MGEAIAAVSMLLFAVSDVLIYRGADNGRKFRGAFLSILITFSLSATLWAGLGQYRGFVPLSLAAIAWFSLAGILTAFIGRVFLYASVQSVGAVKGSAIKRLNPFFSVLFGVWLLGETVSITMAAGMFLIFTAFMLLVYQSLKSPGDEVIGAIHNGLISRLAKLGYLYGPISAIAYAIGYVARKKGLIAMPDPFFGTMTGALTAAIIFVLLSIFSDSFRHDLEDTFTSWNGTLFRAGAFASLGQVGFFAALIYSSVSTVALIISMEVFATIFITYVIFHDRTQLSSGVLLAAILGVLGTILTII